ncbi:MAG TPA: hypothetical protein VJ761_25160 [Ktedonobacteraceae bacterium]|nr:hypothetical protein [Ktedonobacteraceae bacterium]
MYDIVIRAQVEASVVPYELKNIEVTEFMVESAVGTTLEKLFAIVTMKGVTITPSSRELEPDLDSLLSQER